jgi:toxin ParE1/3/4
LTEIWNYSIEKWAVAQADIYVQAIIDESGLLAKNPEHGRFANAIPATLRQRKIASHIIFYVADADTLDVVRILHNRMDIASRLKET